MPRPKQDEARKKWLAGLCRDDKVVFLTDDGSFHLFIVAHTSASEIMGHMPKKDFYTYFKTNTGRSIQSPYGGACGYLVPLTPTYERYFEVQQARKDLSEVLRRLSGNLSNVQDDVVFSLLTQLNPLLTTK